MAGKFSKPRVTPAQEELEIEEAFQESIATRKAESARDDGVLQRNRKIIAISLCALGAVLLVAVIVAIVALAGSGSAAGSDLILDNVSVAGVNIGGMTREQAIEALSRQADSYTREDMVIQLPDTQLRLPPVKTGARLDVQAAVEEAWRYGHSGNRTQDELARKQSGTQIHTVAVLPYLTLDRDYIRTAIEDAFADSSSFRQSSYTLEGQRPALSGEDFDPDAPCQTLVVQMGTPGIGMDTQALYNRVLDAYSLNNFVVSTQYSTHQEPEKPDPEAIFRQYHCDPVDAAMHMETFESSWEVYGYTFDLNTLKRLVDAAVDGQQIRIDMQYITPKVLKADLDKTLYRDVLGSKETELGKDEERITNIRLACKALDGVVLKPGEEFSFRDAVGPITGEGGYVEAIACPGGDDVREMGGGISQISSTLYASVLLSDLRVGQRSPHKYAPDFIEAGLDAAVSGSKQDLTFTNSTLYPIRIRAELLGSKLRIQLLGTDQREYSVRLDIASVLQGASEIAYEKYPEDTEKGYADGDVIRDGKPGRKVTVTLMKFSKETGREISRSQVSVSTYAPLDTIIAQVEPAQIPEPPVEAPEPVE